MGSDGGTTETLLTSGVESGNNVDMQNTTNTPVLTATRIAVGSKTVVVLYADGVEIGRAGGKRAERANAVVAILWPDDKRGPGIYGLRADFCAADSEAARLSVSRPLVHGSGRQPLKNSDGTFMMTTAAEWAVAVPVEG